VIDPHDHRRGRVKNNVVRRDYLRLGAFAMSKTTLSAVLFGLSLLAFLPTSPKVNAAEIFGFNHVAPHSEIVFVARSCSRRHHHCYARANSKWRAMEPYGALRCAQIFAVWDTPKSDVSPPFRYRGCK